jgi:hypothetical protein
MVGRQGIILGWSIDIVVATILNLAFSKMHGRQAHHPSLHLHLGIPSTNHLAMHLSSAS